MYFILNKNKYRYKQSHSRKTDGRRRTSGCSLGCGLGRSLSVWFWDCGGLCGVCGFSGRIYGNEDGTGVSKVTLLESLGECPSYFGLCSYSVGTHASPGNEYTTHVDMSRIAIKWNFLSKIFCSIILMVTITSVT